MVLFLFFLFHKFQFYIYVKTVLLLYHFHWTFLIFLCVLASLFLLFIFPLFILLLNFQLYLFSLDHLVTFPFLLGWACSFIYESFRVGLYFTYLLAMSFQVYNWKHLYFFSLFKIVILQGPLLNCFLASFHHLIKKQNKAKKPPLVCLLWSFTYSIPFFLFFSLSGRECSDMPDFKSIRHIYPLTGFLMRVNHNWCHLCSPMRISCISCLLCCPHLTCHKCKDSISNSNGLAYLFAH